MIATAAYVTEILNRTPNGEISTSAEQATELVARDPNGVTRMRGTDQHLPVSFVTETEVKRMADVAKRERDSLMITVLFQCCLRASECVSITPRHRIFIDSKPVLAIIGKGNKPRLVPIPLELSRWFGDFIQQHDIGLTDRLFPITRFRALQIVKECGERAGIGRRVYTHLLRHGGSVVRLGKTGNLKSLQMYLGHSDIKMTMRYLATLQAVQSLEIESRVTFDK